MTRGRARSRALMFVLAALLGVASVTPAFGQVQEVGSISGTITSGGAPVGMGVADVFSLDTFDYMGTAEANAGGFYTMSNLEPGRYLVVLGNGDDTTWYGYFPELYKDAPYLRLDQSVPVIVKAGSTTTGIDADLEPFYTDMFDVAFEDDVLWMHYTGLTTGCGNGAFCGDDPVTRGQMAAFLVRALPLPPALPSVAFTDDDDSVFESEIEQLASVGITTGCDTGKFCPDDLVTRGQMAAFLVRAMGYTDRGSVSFVDDDDSVFEGDIERLAAAGVTTGCSDGRFCHEDPVTRGQMAAFLHRALGGVLYPDASAEHTLSPWDRGIHR